MIRNLIRNRQQVLLWALILMAAVSLFAFLGSSLFNTKGEPREAVVALSMLQSGDWISPINNGVDIAYKPPFFHWCVALCSLLAGRVTEFSARFPSALATVAMTAVMYRCMLKNKVDCRVAFITCAVTLTTFEVHRAAMACRVDMVLSALTVMALLAFQRWHATRRPWIALAVALLLSGAFLTKGPVGALLPCAVMGAYMLMRGDALWKAVLVAFSFLAASSVLPMLWYYAAYRERGDEFLYLVYEENVLRLLGKMAYSSHEAPAIYNVLTMLSGFLPYTLVAVGALFIAKYRRPDFSAGLKNTAMGWWQKVRGMSDYDLLALLSAVLVFVFYCIPKSKRSVYLLPVYPFAAYFLTRLMLWVARSRRGIVAGLGWFLVALNVALPVLVAVAAAGLVPHSLFHGKHAAENVEYLVSFESMKFSFALAVAVAAAAGGVWIFARWRRLSAARLVASIAILTASFNFMLDGVVLPKVFSVKSDYSVARQIESLVPTDGKIWDYRATWKPGERSRMHQFTVDFYLGDRIVPLDFNKPVGGYLIMGDDDYKPFVSKYPQYALTKIRRFGHRSCDDKRCLTLYKFYTNDKKETKETEAGI